MSSLSDIPVRVENSPRPPAGDPGGLGGGVLAILQEILTLLERLQAGAEAAAIDLRSMPMVPGDRQRLQEALGEGEVEATVDAGGVARVWETAIAGVWWIEYRGAADDEVVTEMIEVTAVPELLVSHRDDRAIAAERLRQQLAGENQAGESGE